MLRNMSVIDFDPSKTLKVISDGVSFDSPYMPKFYYFLTVTYGLTRLLYKI